MKYNIPIQRFILIFSLLFGGLSGQVQTAWFADGDQGEVYGPYPMWQAKFMVNQLTKNPACKINLEIEPDARFGNQDDHGRENGCTRLSVFRLSMAGSIVCRSLTFLIEN